MYQYICGIRPLEPGFKKVCIEPHPDRRLGFAKLHLNTSSGTYEVKWSYENGTLQYEFLIPFDCEATVCVEGYTLHYQCGQHTIKRAVNETNKNELGGTRAT